MSHVFAVAIDIQRKRVTVKRHLFDNNVWHFRRSRLLACLPHTDQDYEFLHRSVSYLMSGLMSIGGKTYHPTRVISVGQQQCLVSLPAG